MKSEKYKQSFLHIIFSFKLIPIMTRNFLNTYGQLWEFVSYFLFY